MKSSFDIVALAKRINLRREELNRLHPGRPVRITPAMSRILENDPEYRPFRERHVSKKGPPVRNPTAGTLVEIAGRLGTTVGDLLGEPVPLSPMDLDVFRSLFRIFERWTGEPLSKITTPLISSSPPTGSRRSKSPRRG